MRHPNTSSCLLLGALLGSPVALAEPATLLKPSELRSAPQGSATRLPGRVWTRPSNSRSNRMARRDTLG